MRRLVPLSQSLGDGRALVVVVQELFVIQPIFLRFHKVLKKETTEL